MQRTTIDFGIDLGTTNSTIAVVKGTEAEVIPNKIGSAITPSAVWIDKRGNLHVGQEAKERALNSDPQNADLEFKLRMGLDAEGKKVFARSRREMLPEDLSAEVLKSLKMDVQTNSGEEVLAAVITVPAAFELPQTQATQRAAERAGFTHCPLLQEPVAASLTYGFQNESDNIYWFVYDFGGGTFDAALMCLRDGLIQVVNHNGDNHLGGKLIDWDIVTKRLIPAATSEFNLPDFRRGNPKWQNVIGRLKFAAEKAKIEVCRTQAASEIWIEDLCEDANGNMVDFAYTLTPTDMERVSQPYIEQSLGLCRKTLADKGISGSNLERILMVGGSTLNPWVRDAVQAELGSKIESSLDPVTLVARGAAIFAGTQNMPEDLVHRNIPTGTWKIKLEHEPVDNVADPDIGGKVIAPAGQNIDAYTIEFVDIKTRWRSGRITLGTSGAFLTQLYAEKKRRCEYQIELYDATGNRVPILPEQVSYTIGPSVMNPPAPHSIGVGMSDGRVDVLIKKGTPLPAKTPVPSDHSSTISLRAGQAEDVLRITVLEGENQRADRNHRIGYLEISGKKIKRDLPLGSDIEITMNMDESQNVQVQAFVPVLDEEFEIKFDTKMMRGSV